MSTQFGGAFKSLPWETVGPSSKFMNSFEEHKRSFSSSTDAHEQFDIPLVMKGVPDSIHYDSAECNVKLMSYVIMSREP